MFVTGTKQLIPLLLTKASIDNVPEPHLLLPISNTGHENSPTQQKRVRNNMAPT